jgi:hypothetical protein
MPRELELEVGNFVCKFGEKLVLVDLLDEVVLPAFFADTTREYRDTEYFFTERQFAYLRKGDADSLALICRFVKNTILRRHQIYSETEGIVHDEQSLPSAPSAVAVLLLKTHRLLYVREVPSAPSMHQYASTFKYLMRNAVFEHRNSIYELRRDSGERVSRTQVKQLIPVPDVHVVPLVSRESLEAFIKRFEKLTSLKVELATTNSELDNEDFFKNLRKRKDEVGSATTIVQHRNPTGLNKKGCTEHVEAAKQGNAYVEMRGVDKNGADLVGNNDNFSIRATLPEHPQSVKRTANASVDKYFELLADKVITIGDFTDDQVQKITESFGRFSAESTS